VEALKQQMQDKEMRLLEQKQQEMMYERKKDEEIRNYQPFGRAGAGAPLRDQHGTCAG
jgi:centrosome and spindle pole-associated protein 1